MASVTSLDGDLRKLRLDKYTPSAAREVKSWIEGVLRDSLPAGDLVESLKDGVALCKLVNLAVPPPGIKFKQSAMPFVQMENISHFLRACRSPPLNLPEHDVFLTVDLYEQKDPAQVLQCLGAFSRVANALNPARFPVAIGPSHSSVLSPQSTGPRTPTATPGRDRGMSAASATSSAFGSHQRPYLSAQKTGDSGSGRWSPTKTPAKNSSPVTSWSRKEHEGVTNPAWNIAQYGYMGGASQDSLGISFGGRRQITSAGPNIPNMSERERRRKEKEIEEEQQRQQREEDERRRKAELEAEEERARLEEERRWEVETQRLREEERRKADEEKRRWEEEERQWKLTEERRRKEEEEAEARLVEERNRTRSRSDVRLQGQFLSQYQAEQGIKPQKTGEDRIAELERELELARERERQYERERQGRTSRQGGDAKTRARSRSRPASRPASRPPSRQESWSRDEREYLRTQWNQHQSEQNDTARTPPPPAKSPRPLPDPSVVASPPKVKSHNTGGSTRPLPDPTTYAAVSSPPQPPQQAPPQQHNRTDRFLASNPAPQETMPQQTYSRELGGTAEQDAEDRRRVQSQAKTKAGGWASKSLLEREMEMERQRQREWEEAQMETAKAARVAAPVAGDGGQPRAGQGLGAGRRQMMGPRPLPGSNR